ncbi:EcsC family protein [Verrucomicrobia bacterium LW23]|nr:EcsC family protein [Verrucomicrobia bacterium LW23]
MTPDFVLQILDFAYAKAITEGNPIPCAQELAATYLKKEGDLEKKIDSLISWQIAQCTTSGILLGLPPGFLFAPLTIPANISSVIYMQVRMVAAIAHMRGYDVKDEQVKTLCYICLTGAAAGGIIGKAGIVLGKKMAYAGVQRISVEVLKRINLIVGARLLTKFGQTGLVSFGKMLPLAGGVIGGIVDYKSTKTIAATAREVLVAQTQA